MSKPRFHKVVDKKRYIKKDFLNKLARTVFFWMKNNQIFPPYSPPLTDPRAVVVALSIAIAGMLGKLGSGRVISTVVISISTARCVQRFLSNPVPLINSL